MKKIILSAVVVAISFMSCKKQDYNDIKVVESVKPTLKPVEPILKSFKSDLPTFPEISAHIVQREYANIKNNNFEQLETPLTKNEYVEKRLIELYPETAYRGMLDAAQIELDTYKKEYDNYISDLKAYEISIGLTPQKEDVYQPFTTLKAEIEYMGMTSQEIEEFNKYEAIATSQVPVTRESLNVLVNNQAENADSRSIILIAGITTAALVGGYSIYRVIQSRNRAETYTNSWYSNNSSYGQKGDAFRHLFVSVLLRRYITRFGSYLVMSLYEVINPNPNSRDTRMDLHNNKVGRGLRYSFFRGTSGDKHKWWNYATRVKNFVNNSDNALNMQTLYNWDNGNPSASITKADEEQVSGYYYIFYRY